MPLIVGYNPPPITQTSTNISYLKLKVGTVYTIFDRAAEDSGSCADTTAWICAMIPIPPHVSPRSNIRISAHCMNTGGNGVLFAYTYPSKDSRGIDGLPLAHWIGTYQDTGYLAMIHRIGQISFTNAYGAYQVIDTTAGIGSGVIILSMTAQNAMSGTGYIKDLTVKCDTDGTESYAYPWPGCV